jgi:hypothetical protein
MSRSRAPSASSQAGHQHRTCCAPAAQRLRQSLRLGRRQARDGGQQIPPGPERDHHRLNPGHPARRSSRSGAMWSSPDLPRWQATAAGLVSFSSRMWRCGTPDTGSCDSGTSQWSRAHMVTAIAADELKEPGMACRWSHPARVRGRKTGQLRTTPVDVMETGGQRWLVAGYGPANWGAQRPRRGRCDPQPGWPPEAVCDRRARARRGGPCPAQVHDRHPGHPSLLRRHARLT